MGSCAATNLHTMSTSPVPWDDGVAHDVACVKAAAHAIRGMRALPGEPHRASVPTMLRLGAVVMKVADVGRAAAFWSAALGYERQPSNPAFLVPDGARGTRLHLDDEDRTHLDLWADDEADQQAQVERLISLGAQRVEWEYPDDADFIVLADPDGNLFCVIA
jgi:catechol 2,3-dioxygenase-like lactoylglutathione lyase family enzyme